MDWDEGEEEDEDEGEGTDKWMIRERGKRMRTLR